MCQEPGSGGVRRAEKGRVPVLSWTDPQQAFGHTGRGVSHPSETSVVWEERPAQPREPRSAQLGSSITHCPTPISGHLARVSHDLPGDRRVGSAQSPEL